MKKIVCYSEYDPLKKVILCSPKFMKIREVINKTQEEFVEENINSDVAVKQHNALIAKLTENNVQVLCLPANEAYPEQVFTRDIGFALDSALFIAKMDRKIRQGEEEILKKWLAEHNISFKEIIEGNIEGGDVLIDNDTVWVGQSFRTSSDAINELQTKLKKFQVNTIPFDGHYLHLDCVFNVISPTEALIFPPALDKDVLNKLSSRYKFIEVSEEEQFTLGTNVLSIGNKKIISLPINKMVNQQLRNQGYTVIEVDITEIIKSGGSFRCITLPILREKKWPATYPHDANVTSRR